MKKEYTVHLPEGLSCQVVVSDEPWQGDLNVTGIDAVTEERLRDAARRKLGLPLVIGETERILLREFIPEDLTALKRLEISGEDLRLLGEDASKFTDAEYLRSYIRNQYPFFGYGIWGIFRKTLQKGSGRENPATQASPDHEKKDRPGQELIGMAGFSPSDRRDETLLPAPDARTLAPVSQPTAPDAQATPPDAQPSADSNVAIELGYYIAPAWRHRSLAEEACRLALDYAVREVQPDTVLIRVKAENAASRRLAEKLCRWSQEPEPSLLMVQIIP